jgi:hypothetical protein
MVWTTGVGIMGQAPHPEFTKGDWVGGGANPHSFKKVLTKVKASSKIHARLLKAA